MKKTIFYALFMLMIGITIVACNKEELITSGQQTAIEQTTSNSTDKIKKNYGGETYRLAYINDQWYCVTPGSGCIYNTFEISATDKTDLTIKQIVTLIELGNVDLNQYFVKNNMRDLFPQLYEKELLGRIASRKLNLVFEFPYLFVNDAAGEPELMYNYIPTLSNPVVIEALKKATGEYTKRVSLNTDTNNPVVWKCITDGDNCKVSAVKFNANWILKNYKYIFTSDKETVVSAELSKDDKGNKILLKTDSGNYYGIEF